jgi:hypothetical protein
MPEECHGILNGEEGSKFTRSTQYETDKPVASGVQIVMFSDKKRENSSELPEYYRNQDKQQSQDSGDGSSTVKTKPSQERDEARVGPDSRRYIGVKTNKSIIRPMYQEINIISII